MKNIILNTILDVDSYKFSHWKQYPPTTTYMFSYLESRGGKYPYTLFFGLQYYLRKYLGSPITMKQVEEARNFATLHKVPFNYEGWKYIAIELKGKIPVRIRAVKEGSIVPLSNILMSVESTDPKCFWIVSWLETMLVRLWYPITVATQSYEIKRMLGEYLDRTADSKDGLTFMLHDFGSRGVSSQESAMIGGASHLVNFLGSDTIAGIYCANKFYDTEMAGFSIPASEHSTMTMWGREREADAFHNMLQQYADQPIIACVSDSYDIYNATKNVWGDILKADVENFKGTLVIRPDSGDPATIVLDLVRILADKFGTTTNTKGYKVLNHVKVIQGDGINQDSIREILDVVVNAGFSVDNLAFGMGGALLQKVNRDTQKFAFKCSAAEVGGKLIDVYKDPVTDTVKKSKKGQLELVCWKEDEKKVWTARRGQGQHSLLEDVFLNGKILRTQTFEEIREISNEEPMQENKGFTDYPKASEY